MYIVMKGEGQVDGLVFLVGAGVCEVRVVGDK